MPNDFIKHNEVVKKRFNDNFEKYGDSPLTLDFFKDKQFRMFWQLTKEWDLNNSSILDFGCGLADFIRFANITGVKNFIYKGIDISEKLIDSCKNKYPNNEFWCGDFLSLPKNMHADYCIASGPFNYKMDGFNQYDFLRAGFKSMYDSCKIAFSANFLTSRVEWRSGEYAEYWEPTKVLDVCYEFSRRVLLSNSVFPFDFTIVVWKDDSFPKELTVFNEADREFEAFIKSKKSGSDT